jgi:hypothetical protein
MSIAAKKIIPLLSDGIFVIATSKPGIGTPGYVLGDKPIFPVFSSTTENNRVLIMELTWLCIPHTINYLL